MEVVNNLGASRSQAKGLSQWNWALLRYSLFSEHMGIIGSNYSMDSNEIGLKSGVMDVGNWVISEVNAQGYKQIDPMLMI